MKTIGCIGVGNMGGAILTAICRKLPEEKVYICDKDAGKTADFQKKFGCIPTDSRSLAQTADTVFLGVKPQFMESMLEEIRDILTARQNAGNPPVCVTMAAGLTAAAIREMIGADLPIIRIMPNMPVAVGQGMILYDCTENVTEEALADFCAMLSLAGRLDRLPEHLIDAGSAVSGCGPAFLCLVLEAMADGGVACGLPRQKALEYAAQTMAGTALQMLESGKHPGVIKDEVTSPGGTTIAGIRAMEEAGVRSGMMEAVIAAYEKTRKIGK